VVAPTLRAVYAAAGVGGCSRDLATFIVAAGVLLVLTIPQPAASTEGLAGQGNLLGEWRAGLTFLLGRKPLLIFILWLAFGSFLLNGPLDLVIPYFISVTGSETQMGVGLTMMSLGAFAGGLLIAGLSNIRPRMKLIIMGTVLNGAMFLVFGVARTLPLMAASLFILMIPLPHQCFYNHPIGSPPDLQGRLCHEHLYCWVELPF
jgi:hypothetical protein